MLMSVMIFKPSQEVAGSGSAGREKQEGRQVIGVEWERCSHPFFPLHVGFFSQNPEGSWQKEWGGVGWGREKAPESGYNVSPVSEDRTP